MYIKCYLEDEVGYEMVVDYSIIHVFCYGIPCL